MQEEFEEAKQDILDKDKLLAESSAEKESLQRQVEASNQALKDTNFLLWENIMKEVKKMNDHIIMLQDERSLVITCL